MADNQLTIDQFIGITGANEEQARALLEACEWNLELAVNMHVDSAPPERQASAMPPLRTEASEPSGSAQGPSNASFGGDDVRPPIQPRTERLIPGPYLPADFDSLPPRSLRSVLHNATPMRDFAQEAADYQMRLEEGEGESSTMTDAKKKSLESIFRPPLDLMFRGGFDLAKIQGKQDNKWLMINVQDSQEFACQMLNRDVWSHPTVKTLIKEHFIFWQIGKEQLESTRYTQFYPVPSYPHIAVLDPRTGERLRVWSMTDPLTFLEAVTDFLNNHPRPDPTAEPAEPPKEITQPAPFAESSSASSSASKTVHELSEQEQIEMAIQKSLEEIEAKAAKARRDGLLTKDDDEDDEDGEPELETFSDSSSDEIEPMEADQGSKAINGKSTPEKQDTEEAEDYKKYLGPEDGRNSELLIRFPDGQREQITFPAESQLQALFLYLSSKGYSMKDYDVVTNFPRRNLKDSLKTSTLASVGLFPRETVFLQQKS